MTPLLEVQNLSRYYKISRGLFRPKALIKALHQVSFSLAQQKTLAIVGESGCGKSTLARQLTLVEPPSEGKILIEGKLIDHRDQKQLGLMRTKIQMVFQNPLASLNPRQKIGTTLEEQLHIHTKLKKIERQEKVFAMMDKVGLRAEYYYRYPHMFSGGQHQRIAIARAMMMHPQIVVADEPVSALDVSIQAQILNLFMDLKDELKTSYVFISHDLSVVEHIADDVLVMYFGSIIEYGNKKHLYEMPLHPYTKALMSATPTISARSRKRTIKIHGEPPSPLDPPTGCAFHQRCPHANQHCATVTPILRTVQDRQVACHRIEEIQ